MQYGDHTRQLYLGSEPRPKSNSRSVHPPLGGHPSRRLTSAKLGLFGVDNLRLPWQIGFTTPSCL